jgi:hypothetical protein
LLAFCGMPCFCTPSDPTSSSTTQSMGFIYQGTQNLTRRNVTCSGLCLQFPLEDYMSEEEQQFRASHKSFKSFAIAMRSLYSHRPSTGFKGVSECNSGRFEARNSSCPVCFSILLALGDVQGGGLAHAWACTKGHWRTAAQAPPSTCCKLQLHAHALCS